MNIFEKVSTMISKQFGVSKETVTLETRFIEDIEAKSLDIMEFIYDVEDAFDIVVDDDVIPTLTTVGAAVRYIESKK